MIPLAADLAAICADDFGETITYYPHGSQARVFPAQVYRQPTSVEMIGEGAYGQNVLEVEFPRHATLGVLTVEANLDQVEILLNSDDPAPTLFRVTRVLTQGHGTWKVLAKV